MRSLRFRTTAPEELPRIREFMARVFQTSMEAPAFEPSLMRWKYYVPRPGWDGSRSYILEQNGEIVSHGCVWPMPFQTSLGRVAACQIIDWAAASKVAGAGMLLRREIEKMVQISAAIGGSPDSRKVIPGSGYAAVTSFRKFARVVRPLCQLHRRPERNLARRVAKFARNALWSLAPVPAYPSGWSITPVTDIDWSPSGYAATARSGELYRYLLQCPAGNLSAFALRKSGCDAGFFLLNQVNGQTRIADFQVRHTEDWEAAVVAVTHTALAIPETCEIVANVSLDHFAQALTRTGYRLLSEQPVFLLDRQHLLADAELHITPVDYDDFFAQFPDSPFAT